jgi:hypothetical protein
MNTTLHSQKNKIYDRIPGLATTDEEVRADIELAMQDYYNGRFISDEDLVKEIKSW